MSRHLLPVISLCACACAAAATRISLSSRDTTPQPPQTLTIPVHLDANQVYSVMVNMSSNAPQAFPFRVVDVHCDNLRRWDFVRLVYNQAASTSVQQLPAQPAQNISMPGFSASGSVIREDCALLTRNGSAWLYPNQTVTVANHSDSLSYRTGSLVSGMMGLGLSPFAQSPAAQWLQNHPTQPAFQVGFALTPPPTNANASSSQNDDGGELHWLAPDQSAYDGEVITTNTNTTGTAPMSWSVQMDGWDAIGAGAKPFNVSQTGTPLSAYLDPFYPNIVFPQSAARVIYANIPGALPLSFGLTPYTNAWSIPCSTKFTLSVTFGTFTTSLDQASLVVRLQDGACVGVLQEWADATIVEYLLGAPFVASIYMILSYAQSGDGSLGFAKRASADSKKLSPGSIAGIALGTVAVLALIIIASVLVYNVYKQRHSSPSALYKAQKQKQKRNQKNRKGSNDTSITPFTNANANDGAAQYARYPNNRLGVPLAQGSPNNYSPRAALLNLNDSSSPDWHSHSSPGSSPPADTNTFGGGTARQHYLSYQTDVPPLPNMPVPSTARNSHVYRGSDDNLNGRLFIAGDAANSSTSLLGSAQTRQPRFPSQSELGLDSPASFDSPPPYRGSPVPLAPLRKGRRQS
ncbi:aspartic peptidase domain-containing protein [Mycena amicta]|nr:aspartic peptidase domain-containing protein [Mycena amicta]